MKKIFLLFTLILTLLFASNVLAFNPTFYVGDGVNGVATQCQAPNYNSINSALQNIYDNNLSNSIIILCQGTYNEDVLLIGDLGISIIGENRNVTIKGVDKDLITITAMGSNLYLKNIKINTAGLYGLGVILSNKVTLENIEVNVNPTSSLDENISAIEVFNSTDVEFKGELLINQITSNKKKITAVNIVSSDLVKINTSKFEIKNLNSPNNFSIINGINIDSSKVNINGNILVKSLIGFQATGILINDSQINNSKKIELYIQDLDSMSNVKGIEIINQSSISLNTDSTIHLLDIGNGNAEAYGLLLKNISSPMLGNLNLSGIAGDSVSHGVYLENIYSLFINEIIFSENKTEDKSTLFEAINSSGDVYKIKDAEETITDNPNFRFIKVAEDSDIRFHEFSVYSGDSFNECIYLEGNSKVKVINGDFKECLPGSIKNKDAHLFIEKPTNFNEDKLIVFQSADSTTEIYKTVNLDFFKNGNKINLNLIEFYNEDGYASNVNLDYEPSIKINLLYYKINFKNKTYDVKTYQDYQVKILFDRINEVPEHFTLNGFSEESYIIEVSPMPIEFIEMRAKDGAAIEKSNHFYVLEKTCSKVESNTYNCYDIEKSRSINGTDFEIDFRIPVDWIVTNGLKSENISLYSYENGKYNLLETTKKELVDNYQKFTAKVNHFSEFKIAGESTVNNTTPPTTPALPSTQPPINTQQDTNTDNNTVNTTPSQTNQEDTEECTITCDEDTEYLDLEKCECIDISDRLGCRIDCGPGYTVDRKNCKCIEIVHEGVRTGTNFFNGVLYFILIALIAILSISLIKKTKKPIKKERKKNDSNNTRSNKKARRK